MNDGNYVIFQELLAAQEAGEAVVLATVVKARGSVPRHAARTCWYGYLDDKLVR